MNCIFSDSCLWCVRFWLIAVVATKNTLPWYSLHGWNENTQEVKYECFLSWTRQNNVPIKKCIFNLVCFDLFSWTLAVISVFDFGLIFRFVYLQTRSGSGCFTKPNARWKWSRGRLRWCKQWLCNPSSLPHSRLLILITYFFQKKHTNGQFAAAGCWCYCHCHSPPSIQYMRWIGPFSPVLAGCCICRAWSVLGLLSATLSHSLKKGTSL